MDAGSIALLRGLAQEIGIGISDKQAARFGVYCDLLAEWNRKFNLTGIEGEGDVVLKHIIDSLTIVKYFAAPPGLKYIEVGTGAGFPGIPIKIVLEDMIDATLIEASEKKVKFLDEVMMQLNMKGINALHKRAEDAARYPEYRGSADIVAARAVAPLPMLLEICVPLLKPGGILIAMKAAWEAVEVELKSAANALDVLGAELGHIDRFCLPGSDIQRSVIQVKKVKETPDRFPRRPGVPAKKPL